jgi:hypothetical protein
VTGSLRVGPVSRAYSIGDLANTNMALGYQGELFVYPRRGLGIGSIVAYNDNEFHDFYVVTFAIALGGP